MQSTTDIMAILDAEDDRWTKAYAGSTSRAARAMAAGRLCEIQEIQDKIKKEGRAMVARVRPGALPKVPTYTGRTGTAPDPGWEEITDPSGRVIGVQDHRPEEDKLQPAEQKPRGPKVTDEETEEMRRLRREGYTARQIAAMTGRPYTTVSKRIHTMEEEK